MSFIIELKYEQFVIFFVLKIGRVGVCFEIVDVYALIKFKGIALRGVEGGMLKCWFTLILLCRM